MNQAIIQATIHLPSPAKNDDNDNSISLHIVSTESYALPPKGQGTYRFTLAAIHLFPTCEIETAKRYIYIFLTFNFHGQRKINEESKTVIKFYLFLSEIIYHMIVILQHFNFIFLPANERMLII